MMNTTPPAPASTEPPVVPAPAEPPSKPAAKLAVKAVRKAAKPATAKEIKPAAAAAAQPAAATKPQKAAVAQRAKAAPKRPARPVSTPAAKPVAKAAPAPAAAKPGKQKEKEKLVRDSFTMPRSDFALVQRLKDRAMGFRHAPKKSELLRAGLHALMAMDDGALQRTLAALTTLKAGRPRKAG